MKFLSLLLIFGFASLAQAMKLEYYGETSLSHNMKFKKSIIGGLSAIVYHDNQLWALSDDKGQYGEPRFYIFELKIQKDSVQLKAKDVRYIAGLPAPLKGEKTILDPEGLVILPSGDLLVSSENNNDKKPRVSPRLLLVNPSGEYKADVNLPEKFIPESLGRQEKGLKHNAGFEGLTLAVDSKWVFAANEAPILTDDSSSEESSQGGRIRILKFNDKHDVVSEFGYQLDAYAKSAAGIEIFRGVSEILTVSESKLLVLERGVRMHKTGWTQTVVLYLADITGADDISKVKNLSSTKLKFIKKEKLLDFETDLQSQRLNKALQNFEGMAWGPILPNKKKSLLMISDNNFSKKELTELLVFSVESE